MYKKRRAIREEKELEKNNQGGWKEWRAKHGKIEASKSRGSKCPRILNLDTNCALRTLFLR
jgi:hypothetical protein